MTKRMSRALWGLALVVLLAACATTGGESRLAGQLPGKRETGRMVALDADVACAPERAFAMWSSTDGVKSFYAPNAEIGGVGGPYTVMFYPDEDPRGLVHGTAGARVLAAEPSRFFAFEWVVFAGRDDKGQGAPPYITDQSQRLPDPLPTWVELTFTPNPGGTRVRLRHYGFGAGADYARSRDWFERAWSGVLEGMRQACSRS